MPRGDGTGPAGLGPMTGRAAGYCAGYGVPGYANPAVGRGLGQGAGRGWRHMYYATGLPGWARWGGWRPHWAFPGPYPGPYGEVDPELEKQALKSQLTTLETALDRIKKRLADLEGESK